MQPGKELNCLIEKEIFGIDACSCVGDFTAIVLEGDPLKRYQCGRCERPLPRAFSTSISPAWEIVQKCKIQGFSVRISDSEGFSYVQIFKTLWQEHIGKSDNAPHAIALAALKALT